MKITKRELQALMKEAVDEGILEQIKKLKQELEETREALDTVLDMAEDNLLSTALYMLFVQEKGLMEEFKQFLAEYGSKQNMVN
jgi:hypothetical protein